MKALRQKKLFFVSMLVGFELVGALSVMLLEGWGLVDGLFWAFQTTTTVGYGSPALTSRASR